VTGVQVGDPVTYTEATHTVSATVRGADPVTAGTRDFTPDRITVKYALRIPNVHSGWQVTAVQLFGPWVSALPDPPTGSGTLLLWLGAAPEWARQFAAAHKPRLRLIE
jgi:hypothetical protein